MQAVRVHEVGGPEKLRLEEIPTPTPGAGQVLVQVKAAGVNFIDTYHRNGLYALPLPVTLGREGAGTVQALGEGVNGVKEGDHVGWALDGFSYATHSVVAAERLVPIPVNLGFEEAAALLLQGMTAHYLTHSTYPLKTGETCLIHAAAGGVGLLLCQLAKMRGARVIGTTSTEEKASLARAAGADEVILYSREDFLPAVKRLTGGQGVDVVYESVGKDTFDRSLDCLRPRGYLVLFGQSSGPVPPFDPQILNGKGSLFLTRPSLIHYVRTRAELLERAGDVLGWAAAGKLSVRIDRRYSLEEAAQAHIDLESRRTSGKVILTFN
jgi:NADPH:quinone reductase